MNFKKILKNILKTKAVICCLSCLIYIYAQFVGITCKWTMKNIKQVREATKNTNAIWIAWHSRATMMPFFWQKLFNRKMAALVSPHHDGQIIAHFLKWYGIMPVNGSTNENPRQSALELMRELQNGYELFISPDGPRGPRMRMKKSPIYYAQKTGKPIICACFSLNRALIIDKAWDKTVIALPFAKGCFALSEPLYVPKDLSAEEFEAYRIRLENIANKLSIECDTDAGRNPILPADINDIKKKKE